MIVIDQDRLVQARTWCWGTSGAHPGAWDRRALGGWARLGFTLVDGAWGRRTFGAGARLGSTLGDGADPLYLYVILCTVQCCLLAY
jgi:hypothetical protein